MPIGRNMTICVENLWLLKTKDTKRNGRVTASRKKTIVLRKSFNLSSKQTFLQQQGKVLSLYLMVSPKQSKQKSHNGEIAIPFTVVIVKPACTLCTLAGREMQ